MDISGLTSSLYTNGTNANNTASANSLSNTVSSLSSDSTDEELMDAIKDFESYFVEKILKDVKETLTSFGDDDDEDSSMSQITDMYMDNVYEELADTVTDGIGSSLTQQLFEQMKRNYNIATVDDGTASDTTAATEAAASVKAAEEAE